MQAQEILAQAVESTKMLTARYLAGFEESTRTTQARHLPNHVAWNLGHLALTMHRIAEKYDGGPAPERDFSPGPRGNSDHFGLESVAFGSVPVDDPTVYPALARCVQIYDAACDRLARALRAAPESKLSEVVKWGAGESTLGMLAARMVFHNGFHTGQIADLRRATGMRSIFS